MDKKKIQAEYSKKIKNLHKFGKAYFDKDNPIVSDQKYDDLQLEIFNLEKSGRKNIILITSDKDDIIFFKDHFSVARVNERLNKFIF